VGQSFNDSGMAMADNRYIVVAVQIAAPIGVVEPYAFTPCHVQGLLVEEAIRRRKNPLTASERFTCR